MKNILILTTALTLSATVFAFGGGGGGRKSTAFTSGVDAIGVHMGGKEQISIDYVDNGENESNTDDETNPEQDTQTTCPDGTTVCTNGEVCCPNKEHNFLTGYSCETSCSYF